MMVLIVFPSIKGKGSTKLAIVSGCIGGFLSLLQEGQTDLVDEGFLVLTSSLPLSHCWEHKAPKDNLKFPS